MERVKAKEVLNVLTMVERVWAPVLILVCTIVSVDTGCFQVATFVKELGKHFLR